jgi:hypothetical protein
LYAARHARGDSLDAFMRTLPTSPHGASVDFERIKRAMRERLPNGWANEFRDSVPATTWTDLAALHARWLAAHEGHALAPWVRFSRARLAYFQGDTAGACRRR